MKTWIEPQPVAVSDELVALVGGHRIVAESLVRRGITTVKQAQAFLDPAYYQPADPFELPDMALAVERLQQAIQEQEAILVWGDFDVDGQTSTALLVSALRDLGANVSYHVPNRFTEGHGIYLPTLTQKLDAGIDLLLTCDTGIAAHESILYAQSRGVDVIVTDHHALTETLPPAYACVNPMRLPEGHPLRELPGVGTAYQLIRALYGERSTDHLLDLVALGIVADVMVQVDDTRYWLQRGLEVLRQRPRASLQAMFKRAEIDPLDLSESDIGFKIAPRLNALGRLKDANPAVSWLISDDHAEITEQVNELEGLNQQRRYHTEQIYQATQQVIQNDPSLLKYAGLVIVGAGWHTGVLGIVASRLVSEYNCPVILLSDENGALHGSARSVTGCNIIEAIRSQASLLKSFGGHNMAAGLSLTEENLIPFRRGFSGAVREQLGQAEVVPTLVIDGFVSLAELDLPFTEDIARLAPFGNGNPALTLAVRDIRIIGQKSLGRKGDHIELRVADASGVEGRVVWWFADVSAIPQGHFDLAFMVRPNVFNGKRSVMIEWLSARPLAGESDELVSTPTYEVLSYRRLGYVDAYAQLQDFREEYPDLLIWAEGADVPEGAVNRYKLYPAETLLIWTKPPSASDWHAILNVVKPRRLILMGQGSEPTTFADLLSRSVGLVKYAQNRKGGVIMVTELASALAQTEAFAQAIIQWLQAVTNFDFTEVGTGSFFMGESPKADSVGDVVTRLKHLFRESESYRQFWMRMDH